LWDEHRPNFANSAPAIADVNGDTVLDIVVVGNVYNRHQSYLTFTRCLSYSMPNRTRLADAIFDWTAIPVPDGNAEPLSEDYNLIENNVPNPVLQTLITMDIWNHLSTPMMGGCTPTGWIRPARQLALFGV
jgi:hypothetical protein